MSKTRRAKHPMWNTLTPRSRKCAPYMRLNNDDGLCMPEQVTVLEKILRRPEGMVILSGSTGSGKLIFSS